MTSPDRMQLMEERSARLANLMRDLAQAELEDRERMLVHEGWMRMHEERAQSMEAHRRESDERVRAIIATLTEMQADIARIDAGS